MISTQNVTVKFGSQILFENVSIKFTPGNCYGLIGANGSGKSTFLKVLAGEIEPTHGEVAVTPGFRIATLKQDQHAFNEYKVLDTVILGHSTLYAVMKEKDEIYNKGDFSDADGLRAAELEDLFAKLHGWEAEADAAQLLSKVDIPEELHSRTMKELTGAQKVRVLLAQALFGNPDILLLDEPTNHLDVETITWLEDFLADFKNTVVVVSHDRHFLDQVCTHMADIDYHKIQLYTGNYSFWMESSQLALRLTSEKNKKIEDKREELLAFIRRFSANASKSRQATSRKRLLEKLTIDDIKPSLRKYPAIFFEQERVAGEDVLTVRDLAASYAGVPLFKEINLQFKRGQKVGFLSQHDLILETFFDIIMGEKVPQAGSVKWGVTINPAYFPRENSKYFQKDCQVIDWLKNFSKNKDEEYVRGFLGKMLFTGEEVLKSIKVLSGGEKQRCMFSRMMVQKANVLVFNEPTNHLDLEAITAFNRGLEKYPGTVFLASHDHTLLETICDRIIEIGPKGMIDRLTDFDDYLQKEHDRRSLLY
jgi:ATPase subunit of ABC transporter with duplicated ATPase domains